MSLWTRMANVFRGERLNREIDEELDAHLEEAMASGRDAEEARRALGSKLRHREESRDARILTWFDSLLADAGFGWRQLKRNKITSAAAILSLALAIGACTAAFRLIDALLLRPLPVAGAERLYLVVRHGLSMDGVPGTFDGTEYPLYQQMRATVRNQAELIALSYNARMDLTYGTDEEIEKAHLQYVSWQMFGTFGLHPAVGRLLTESDDDKPGRHPYAVLSYDYWTSRFGKDPNVTGRTFRMGDTLYEIVGVIDKPFTGTEPGTVTDIFVPTMMNEGVTHADWSWIRLMAQLKPGVGGESVRAKLQGNFRVFQEEQAKNLAGRPKQKLANFLNQKIVLEPATAGISAMQKDNRPGLLALGVLVGLVLLVACANVANLMTAQAAARAREMALRISLGAGSARLVQLVLVQSALIAVLAAGIGGLFAWWSAPFVVGRINPPDNPARISLPADWRVMGFALVLTLAVTFLFGLIPALRASAIKPASALKGGEDPHSLRRLMNALIAAQVAFCFLVLFVAGLFVATFERLSHQPNGFSAERVITFDTVARKPQPPVFWNQVVEQLRAQPGVEAVSLCGWPLLDGNGWNGFVAVNGGPPSQALAYFLGVSRGWVETMKIRLIDGRDFLESDAYPGTAIVNEAFAKAYFGGEDPVGRSFDRTFDHTHFHIVGLVADARYRNMREPITPTAYVPFQAVEASGGLQPISKGTYIVRTASATPPALAGTLRQEISRARPEFRVSRVRTQQEINDAHTVRERLLAMLATFFSAVALLLAGIGLYGVLHYTVLQRRREIGIRMAVGAQGHNIARLVAVRVFAMVMAGALAGLVLGMVSARYIESLFYQVKATDLGMLAFPSLAILGAALLAAVVPVIRAVRIDPATMLRAE
jgi:putative ABC transport system permease protein